MFQKRLSIVLIRMIVASWRILFCVCPWIRVEVQFDSESFLGTPGKPALLLMNHTSFFDTIIAVHLAPFRRCGDVRVLVANHIFNIPILSTILKALALPEVPFKAKSGDDISNMAVDKEVMDERLSEFQKHVAQGGIGAWFPEGYRNRDDPHVLQAFRAGAFRIGVSLDCEVWCMAIVGATVCWPAKATVGGFPARIGVKCFKLADSSHALLAKHPTAITDREKSIALAELTKKSMQAAIDGLVCQGFSSATPALSKKS